jgi:hypothetical protein
VGLAAGLYRSGDDTGAEQHHRIAHDVVDAVAAGRFHVWTLETLDDALELLTGRDPGRPDEQGRFPSGTANARVAARLRTFAENSRRFSAQGAGSGDD